MRFLLAIALAIGFPFFDSRALLIPQVLAGVRTEEEAYFRYGLKS
jgi:hypothetical protein